MSQDLKGSFFFLLLFGFKVFLYFSLFSYLLLTALYLLLAWMITNMDVTWAVIIDAEYLGELRLFWTVYSVLLLSAGTLVMMMMMMIREKKKKKTNKNVPRPPQVLDALMVLLIPFCPRLCFFWTSCSWVYSLCELYLVSSRHSLKNRKNMSKASKGKANIPVIDCDKAMNCRWRLTSKELDKKRKAGVHDSRINVFFSFVFYF